jgi:hypothetical protein
MAIDMEKLKQVMEDFKAQSPKMFRKIEASEPGGVLAIAWDLSVQPLVTAPFPTTKQ